MRRSTPKRYRSLVASLAVVLVAALAPGVAQPQARAASSGSVLDEDAILSSQGLADPQWYKDNIPFVDTPDANINGVYYYRWGSFKQALRYTTPGAGYISTEYDDLWKLVPVS